ncbi:alpha/beta-hydrolase [Dendrothele bispora CBS 962.96]|uniref:Alpha/beta-hydrolase n=1 Tax=Dendrothele bispora (strain CBS 962.96) TaxID=1314807 RepID=A0A4S8MCF0_DENBC|nr:alpha/beta-hydrolase [Dendrothele bispora CBS 962.96]
MMSRFYKSQAFFLLTLLKVAIAQESFDWSTIEPSTNLSWVDCYSQFQCARYQVPLNYSEPDGGTAAIAVIKLNATVEASQYGGPIFLNPGGPGVSGISFALGVAPFLQPVFGNQFDIIGFDPRGVNNSTPKTSIFRTEEESSAWFAQDVTDLNSTKEALPEAWARYQVFGQLAQNRNDDNSLNFVSTDNVARDMLSMVEAFGEEKLQFYGASYGTALGALFSTMFPDRVGRVVLDGCLDMDGYFNNDMKFMVEDIDKAMQTFFDTCHSAGPQACAFYDSSPSQIEANLEAIYDSVRKQPIPYVSGDTFSIITYDVLRETILLVLRMQELFPGLAAGLKGLSTGNGTSIFQLINELLAPPSEAGPTAESLIAIECSDTNPSERDVLQLQSDMASINSTFAGTEGLQIMTYCSGWKIRPEGRFNGPVGGNTSFPLLIMSSTIDPATPLSGAKKTSSAFPGSALLQQDSVGHTALFAAGSNCTFQHLAAYFANGTLPEEGTICPANIPPFGGVNNTTSGISPRSFPLPRLRH